MSGSCTGVCCSAFPYPSTPAELRARWDRIPDTSEGCRDDLFIADMLIVLTPEEAAERKAKYGLHAALGYDIDWSPPIEIVYTCRHWDEGEMKCGVYDERPMMCREYPYEKECEHGCGFTETPDVVARWVEI